MTEQYVSLMRKQYRRLYQKNNVAYVCRFDATTKKGGKESMYA